MTGAKTGHSKNTETVAIQVISMSFQLFIADYVGPVGQVSEKNKTKWSSSSSSESTAV